MSVIMKKFLLTFSLFIVITGNIFGKSSENAKDTIAFMQNMVTLGNNNKGEKISVIIDSFRRRNFHIEFLDYYYTSPFIDPEGKGYLECINISCYSPSLDRWPVLTIYINETNCESEHFEDDMHAYDGNGEERATRIKDLFTIKKVEFDFWPVDYSKKK